MNRAAACAIICLSSCWLVFRRVLLENRLSFSRSTTSASVVGKAAMAANGVTAEKARRGSDELTRSQNSCRCSTCRRCGLPTISAALMAPLRLHQSPPPLDEPESTSPPRQPSLAPMSTGCRIGGRSIAEESGLEAASARRKGVAQPRVAVPFEQLFRPQAGYNTAGDCHAGPQHAAAARRGCRRVAADQVIDEIVISPALRAGIDDLAKIRFTGRSRLMTHASEEQERKTNAPKGSPTGRTTPVSRVFSTKHNFTSKINSAAHQEIVKEDSKCHFHFMIL